MKHTQDRVASIDRAWIAVIGRWGQTCTAGTGSVTRIGAVARIGISTGCPGGSGVVMNARCGVAGVDSAGITVINNRSRPGDTDTATIANFRSVAGVAVAA